LKALKWIGGGLLVIIALITMGESEGSGFSRVVFVGIVAYYALNEWHKAEKRAIAMQQAIQRIEYKLEGLSKEVNAIGIDLIVIRQDLASVAPPRQAAGAVFKAYSQARGL